MGFWKAKIWPRYFIRFRAHTALCETDMNHDRAILIHRSKINLEMHKSVLLYFRNYYIFLKEGSKYCQIKTQQALSFPSYKKKGKEGAKKSMNCFCYFLKYKWCGYFCFVLSRSYVTTSESFRITGFAADFIWVREWFWSPLERISHSYKQKTVGSIVSVLSNLYLKGGNGMP